MRMVLTVEADNSKGVLREGDELDLLSSALLFLSGQHAGEGFTQLPVRSYTVLSHVRLEVAE